MLTKDFGTIISQVKKVPLVYKPTKDIEIFGGHGIYDPHTNQVICQISSTANFTTNKSIIEPLTKVGWEFFYANVNNARTLYHISGLLPVGLVDDDGVQFQSGIEITNSYNNSYVTEYRLFFYSKEHSVILRTCISSTIDSLGINSFGTIIRLAENNVGFFSFDKYDIPEKVKIYARKYLDEHYPQTFGLSWTHFHIMKALGYACYNIWEKTAYTTARTFMSNLQL